MSNIFETFQGADLDRFVKCVLAVRDADLTIGTHTHTSINQRSGNVWIWDEDWAGSVACSPDNTVSWFYNCRECGSEYSFSTYAELQTYDANYEGECARCKTEEVEE